MLSFIGLVIVGKEVVRKNMPTRDYVERWKGEHQYSRYHNKKDVGTEQALNVTIKWVLWIEDSHTFFSSSRRTGCFVGKVYHLEHSIMLLSS